MRSDERTHKQDFQTQARWALGWHSALEVWRCEKLPLMLVCGTRILWVGAVVCWPRILGVGAEGFAGRGSSGLALDIVLLAKTPRSPRCTSFACRGSPRLALKVVCWPRILEVAAEGRLLAGDLGRCRPFACRGSRRLALKIVRWHMILEIDAQRRLLAEDHRALPRILISGLFAGHGCSGFAMSFACRGS